MTLLLGNSHTESHLQTNFAYPYFNDGQIEKNPACFPFWKCILMIGLPKTAMKTILPVFNLSLFTRVSDPFPVFLGNGLSKGIMVILTLTIIMDLIIIIFFIIIIIIAIFIIIIINLVIVVIIIIVINIIVIIIFLLFQGPQQWGSSIPKSGLKLSCNSVVSKVIFGTQLLCTLLVPKLVPTLLYNPES